MKHVIIGVALLLSACIGDLPARECASSSDCVRSGQPGTCLPSGSGPKWCAFAAPECASGNRWGRLAGEGLADVCVGDEGVDAADGRRADAAAADAGAPPDAGPAQLILDQEGFDFGAVRPDQSVTHPFTITNIGGLPSGNLDITITGAGTSAYALDAAACQGAPLAQGTGCTVNVTFSTVTPGAQDAQLVVTASPGGTAMATLEGSGLAPPALTSDPPAAGFGTVTTGTTPTIGLSIRNGGALDTGVLSTTIDGADAARFSTMNDGCKAKPLGAASSCSVTVVFSPTTEGARSARLTIGDGPNKVEVPLTADAVAPGVLTLMPEVPTFADVAIGGTSTAVMTVKNIGGTTVTGLVTSISGTAASDFTLSPDGCNGQNLAPNVSCDVTIRFRPTVAGTKSASFSVRPASGGTASTSLTARGTARLSVSIAGAGSGSVSSNPVGIQCASGSTTGCTFDFAATSVILTPAPAGNSTFDGWSGGGCSGTGTCTVSLSTAQSVTATFSLRRYTVTVTKTGLGSSNGRVTSVSGGINCGSTCSADVTAGQSITLNAVDMPPGATGSLFQGWSGAGCTGTGPCVVTPTSAVTVTANFKGYPEIFFIVGQFCFFGICTYPNVLPGRVFTNPSLFDSSGAQEIQSFFLLDGTALEVNAVAPTDTKWAGWSIAGIDESTDTVVKYTTRYQNPRAFTVPGQLIVHTFFSAPGEVTVNIASGAGTVTSIPPGIACPVGLCTGTFARGSGILLRADRAATWTGVTCAQGTLCELGVEEGRSITVTFPP